MKKYLTNVLLLLCLLTACSKSDGGNDEGSEDWMKDFAPTSIRNKGLCLSMGETMNNWYIKILQKSQNEVLMVANDASWKLSDFYCEYSKTGTNEGFLIIEYTINIGEMSVEHYEELTLNFSSAHGGTFDGIDEYYSNGIERENRVNGKFTFDMGDLSDFDEDGGDKSASSLLGVKISSVFASIQTSIPYPNFTITVSVVKNSTQGLPQTVGFCMGTSPHPTLENAVFVNEEKSGYMNNYASVLGGLIGYIGILKPATRYFIRPYHKEGNKVIYYQEQSVETLGGEISLELKETSPQHFSLRYDIKKQGTYRMYAQYRIHTSGYCNNDKFVNDELGTKSKGSGSIAFDLSGISYTWRQVHVLWGEIEDLSTGIIYTAPQAFYGGTGEIIYQ